MARRTTKIKLKRKKKPLKFRKKILIKKKAPETLFKAKIKIVGIGGGGGSIVSEIGKSLEKVNFVIADTDIRALKKKPGIKYFWFGQDFTHGLGTGVNPNLAREAAEKDKEKIAELFRGQDIVIFIASLGGGLGSGAVEVFAEAAKKFGGITFGIFTLPFKFEGKKKSSIAQKALKKVRELVNVSITISNEKIFKVINNDTPIVQAFSIVNKNLAASLESLIDLIYSPGLINIDFADLRTILKGRGNLAFFNTAESSGKDKAEKMIKKIIYNPLYQNNNFTAEKILFNVSGDSSLNMFEVEKISRSIADINPKAKIIFGVSKNPSLKKKIKAVLLMAGPAKSSNLRSRPAGKRKKEAPLKEKEKKLPVAKIKKNKKAKEIILVPFAPAFNKIPVMDTEILSQVKKTIRRSALEIKKAEDLEEDKKILQEKEWEIPAFLRKVRLKS
ncbi:MAG: hypothetical protein CEN87_461 [Parcubacteria group bacterium Licking1014_1]|nr:MAG: hypothetical protein CEN87_461 [Parcubacteria group bacterium Licking1014_1]